MRLILRILGAEIFAIDTSEPTQLPDRGDCTTTPIGFTRGEHE